METEKFSLLLAFTSTSGDAQTINMSSSFYFFFDKEPNGAVNTNDNTFHLNSRCLPGTGETKKKFNFVHVIEL